MKNEFIKSVISNDNGVGSSNRMALIFIVIALVTWTSYVVFTTGSIPDIADSWIYIIGIFVGGTATGKATDAYKKSKSDVNEPDQG